jgi:hypothetical protein
VHAVCLFSIVCLLFRCCSELMCFRVHWPCSMICASRCSALLNPLAAIVAYDGGKKHGSLKVTSGVSQRMM